VPRTLRKLPPNRDVRLLQKLLHSNGYLRDALPADGLFDQVTNDEVVLFQLQHIDEQGQPLKSDGEVGPLTWWALKNPSGESQRNHFEGVIPDGLTNTRNQLLSLVIEEHGQPVFEIPDGSNRSPDIDQYWGNTGVLGKAWCCAFVSWALLEVLGELPIEGKHHLGVQRMWRAAKRQGMGIEQPKPGDIFVQIKSGGTGHTGFVVGASEDDQHIYTCEGNTGNRIKIGKRAADTIHHYIDCLGDGQGAGFEHRDLDVAHLDGEADR
jgi:hypothetical protein